MKKKYTVSYLLIRCCSICTALLLYSFNVATAQYTGGDGRGDVMAESAETSLIFIYVGGQGRGEATAASGVRTITGNSIVLWRGGAAGAVNAWNNANNWVAGVVPSPTDWIAIEPNGNGHQPILDQNRTAAALFFNAAEKKVDLAGFNLTLTETTEGFDAIHYFRTQGTGTLNRLLSTTNRTFLFPVGKSSYNPVTITNNNSEETFSVRVDDAVYMNGLDGQEVTLPRVNRTWHIGKTNPTQNTTGVDFVLQWNQTDERDGINSFQLNHHNGVGWLIASSSGGNETISSDYPKTLSFTGYRGDFSPFAISSTTQPLPATDLALKARTDKQHVLLQWRTLSENNTSHFEIERSSNGSDFTRIGRITASGNSSSEKTYLYRDMLPPTGLLWYRLRQVSLTGSQALSNIIPLSLPTRSQPWAGPVPANALLTLQLPASFADTYVYQLHDVSGKLVMQGGGLKAGANNIQINQLAPGMYYLTILSNGERIYQQWISKQ